jgi:hypothetical protein
METQICRAIIKNIFERSKPKIWSSHSCGYEELCLLGNEAVQSGESQLTFRRNKADYTALYKGR